MSVKIEGKEKYIGAVIGTKAQYHYDGMTDEYAIVWDMEKHSMDLVHVGYYGSDGYNFVDATCNVDLSVEVARDIIRTFKSEALDAYADSVVAEKKAIRKDRMAEVVKGRKVKKGTILKIFWVGERPTYRSRMYSYINETELVAGGYDEDGNKIWIKADYLKNLTIIKSPVAAERKRFVDEYVKRHVSMRIREIAIGEQ